MRAQPRRNRVTAARAAGGEAGYTRRTGLPKKNDRRNILPDAGAAEVRISRGRNTRLAENVGHQVLQVLCDIGAAEVRLSGVGTPDWPKM